ncbi:hypothetical protein ES708_24650 [subsurface metagenome]
MRHKSPSELNSKTIRISLGDYALLDGISRQARITFAEALHLVITDRARQAPEVKPRALPMAQPAFRVTTPIALRQRLAPVLATNGNKVVALGIKPKGARYDD